ncbi:MAG TPA: aldo/keto reductase [Bryobacteraceae bacterium]|nr:aldo/keto reductase [Bryobacteraceae bacterium]
MEYRLLGSTGLHVSIVGFGAAPLGDEYGKLDTQEAERAVHRALDVGINFFDTAPYYGRTLSETRLGQALKGRREKAIVATKVARYGVTEFDFSAATVTRTTEESLRRLQTDHLDLLQVHDVEFGDASQIINETLPALRQLQEQGKTRFVGITGLSLKMLQDIATQYPVDSILSYCRYNLLNRDLEMSLAPFCREKKIGLINASPLHMQLLGGEAIPSWHPAPESVRDAAHEIIRLCRSRDTSPASVALKFASSHQDVASTFIGLTTVAQVDESVAALSSSPEVDLLAEIDTLTQPVRRTIWITGKAENH